MTALEAVLATGLRVQVVRRPSVPLVRVRLQVPQSRRTPATELLVAGLAAVRTPGARRLRRAGGLLVAWTTAEGVSVDGHAATAALPELLAGVAEATRSPLAGPDAARIRPGLAARLAATARDPGVVAATVLNRLRFADHPGLRPPDPAALAEVGPDELAAARERLRPDGSILVVVGDLDPEDALRLVGAEFGGWSTPGPARRLELPAPTESARALHRPGPDSALLRLATAAPGLDDDGEAAFQLATVVLGGYFGSRLVRRLRHEAAIAYSVRAGTDALVAARSVVVDVRLRAGDAASAVRTVRAELARFAVDGPSPGELAAARRYVLGRFAASGATQADLVEGLALLAAGGVDRGWPDRHVARLEAATRGQVAVAAHRIGTADWSHTLVGGRPGLYGEEAA